MNGVKRTTDVCVRLGGEEFAIILPATELDVAYDLAETLRKEVESSLSPINKYITISLGVGEYSVQKESITKFIDRVDISLYKAKNSGRNKSVISN
jgi:diguanylate cyclase (GGDEF)-like protein